MSYLAQDNSESYKRASAGVINVTIMIGVAIGIYYMIKPKKKKSIRAKSNKKYRRSKVRPLPR